MSCGARSAQGNVCARDARHRGCHEVYVDGDGRRWWGDARWGLWVVQYRPVGWSSLAVASGAALVVARGQEEAEAQAAVVLGLPGRIVCPPEEAAKYLGTDRAAEAGWGTAVWFNSGRIDEMRSGVPHVRGGVVGLERALNVLRGLRSGGLVIS